MDAEVLLFDIGGTVFDWRTAVINALEVSDSTDLRSVDKKSFSEAWRKQSLIEVEAVANLQAEWRRFDDILETSLQKTLSDFDIHNTSYSNKESLIHSWERMPAWPEAKDSLNRLREKYFLSPHTILSLRVASFSSRNANITWDAIISCDSLRTMKMNPESYRLALETLRRPPDEVCFVASHPSDLRAASSQGMQTAYVEARLEEYGENYHDTDFSTEFNIVAENFDDLVNKMTGR